MNMLSAYRSFLQDQGYRPEVADDYLTFVHEGGYYVVALGGGEHCLCVLFPSFWRIEPANELRAFEAAAQTSALVTAVKVLPLVVNSPSGPVRHATAAIELLLANPTDFQQLLPRALRQLQMAAHCFRMAMVASAAKEQTEQAEQLRRSMDDGGAPSS
jgi:hypothetical protein